MSTLSACKALETIVTCKRFIYTMTEAGYIIELAPIDFVHLFLSEVPKDLPDRPLAALSVGIPTVRCVVCLDVHYKELLPYSAKERGIKHIRP